MIANGLEPRLEMILLSPNTICLIRLWYIATWIHTHVYIYICMLCVGVCSGKTLCDVVLCVPAVRQAISKALVAFYQKCKAVDRVVMLWVTCCPCDGIATRCIALQPAIVWECDPVITPCQFSLTHHHQYICTDDGGTLYYHYYFFRPYYR